MSKEHAIAGRLSLPGSIGAILWDMDGVLIDSIKLDFDICTSLVRRFVDPSVTIPAELIKEGFALSPADFWRFLLSRLEVEATAAQLESLIARYELERNVASYALNPGVDELLQELHESGWRMAVVSNNKRSDIINILENTAISGIFAGVVGNDHGDLKKKPAPDAYLEAARLLGVPAGDCAIIEDSVIGIAAGKAAGGYTIGVSTGGETFDSLCEAAPHVCYTGFTMRKVKLFVGNVLDKNIRTPNEFVSHMIEHIAWRLGASIDLSWNNDDWFALGVALGSEISRLGARRGAAAVVGMIDDGGAEVRLELNGVAGLDFAAVAGVSLDHFLAARCEQLKSGAPLKRLIEGLVQGLPARLSVRVSSFEDPHHTWEGVFRAIGIALSKAFGVAPPAEHVADERWPCVVGDEADETMTQGAGFLAVSGLSANRCQVRRETAESIVQLNVELSDAPAATTHISVSPSIDVSSFGDMLGIFAASAGLTIQLNFSATKLSSSHVVLEDTGLVLGAALFKIMEARMSTLGVNGAGSSFRCVEDFDRAAVACAVSVEGRKFIKLVPFDVSLSEFKRAYIIGQDAFGTLRCEDIDDFLDALAGGMKSSILVHFRRVKSHCAGTLWREAVVALGGAVKEAMAINPLRKGLPPGVKATLV